MLDFILLQTAECKQHFNQPPANKKGYVLIFTPVFQCVLRHAEINQGSHHSKKQKVSNIKRISYVYDVAIDCTSKKARNQ